MLGSSLALAAPAAARPLGPEVFAERRRRLAADVGSGVIALVGHDDASGQSGFTGFRQESNFYYLTGHDEPGAALLIAPARGKRGYREIVFLPSPSGSAVLWSGPMRTPADTGDLAFDEALGQDRFRPELRSLLRDRGKLFALRPRAEGDPGNRLLRQADGVVRERDIREVGPALARMRSVKSPEEIALIQKAVEATVSGHRAAWKAVADGSTERSMVAEFVGAVFRAGCQRLAFPPMAGAGPNGAVLHYRRHDSVMRSGQMVLLDAGAECFRYAADIARTVPVDSGLSAEQRRLYQLVLGAQRAAIRQVRSGATLGGTGLGSLLAVAERHMRERAPRGLATGLPHALGHHVGLDVHDPVPSRAPLKPGMVITIEPGLYLPGRGIGIRIEDMVEVTEDGCRLMTGQLPVAPDDVESALADLRAD